nr:MULTISPECIES: helix-turn-helix transcriptional regulator [Pseudomonas syringae group]
MGDGLKSFLPTSTPRWYHAEGAFLGGLPCIGIIEIPIHQDNISTFDLIKPWVLALMKQQIASEIGESKNSRPQQWQDRIVKLAPKLTSREIEVLKLALSGFSNSEISGKLSVSSETVKVHRRNLYSKLNIKS